MRISNRRLIEAVKHTLKERDTTRKKLSADIGISDVYLWKLESGRCTNPREATLLAISDNLKIDEEYLFGEWKRLVREDLRRQKDSVSVVNER